MLWSGLAFLIAFFLLILVCPYGLSYGVILFLVILVVVLGLWWGEMANLTFDAYMNVHNLKQETRKIYQV